MDINIFITDEKIASIYRQYKDTMPFQVVEFAIAIGIDVYTDDMPSNISGKIEKKDEKFICYVNNKNAVHRQVFTIAHELGHYFRHQEWFAENNTIEEKEEKALYNTFHKDQPQSYSQNQKQMEKEANEFAAELLMPEDIVKEQWQECKSVNKMAKYFGVSEIAMSIRIANVIEDIRFMV